MITVLVVLSLSVAIADSLSLPITRSPSQCPGISLPFTSSGLSSILIGSFIVVRLSLPRRTLPYIFSFAEGFECTLFLVLAYNEHRYKVYTFCAYLHSFIIRVMT
jgi:hypothetical protein